jgi:hypothetical protein
MLVIGATVVATVNGPSVTAERIGQLLVASTRTPPSLEELLEAQDAATTMQPTITKGQKDRSKTRVSVMDKSYPYLGEGHLIVRDTYV